MPAVPPCRRAVVPSCPRETTSPAISQRDDVGRERSAGLEGVGVLVVGAGHVVVEVQHTTV
eukprot:scaffold22279_cov123-Isochrysis_galbana.AAC.8